MELARVPGGIIQVLLTRILMRRMMMEKKSENGIDVFCIQVGYPKNYPKVGSLGSGPSGAGMGRLAWLALSVG